MRYMHVHKLHANARATSLQMFKDFNDAMEDICNNDLPSVYTKYCSLLMRFVTRGAYMHAAVDC